MNESKNNIWLPPLAIGAYFAVFKLLLHFTFNSNYGYFRNELLPQDEKASSEVWENLKHWN